MAAEGEERETKAAAVEKEKNNEMNIGRESRNYYTSTPERGGDGRGSTRLAYINWGRFGRYRYFREGSNAEKRFVSYTGGLRDNYSFIRDAINLRAAAEMAVSLPESFIWTEVN